MYHFNSRRNANFSFLTIILVLLTIVSTATIASAATFTVNRLTDTNDKVCDADCSLREAITAANLATTDDVIEFDRTVFTAGRTISLTGGELIITDDGGTLTINGTAFLTISSNNRSRVLFINSAIVTLKSIAINNGNGTGMVNGLGGGIYNARGILTLNNSSVSFNSGSVGGGIYNGGTLNLNDSTISSNKATDLSSGSGGGIYNSGTMMATNSNIASNTASTDGGGINNDNGNLTLNNSTLSNNVAANSRNGGGIHNKFGTVNLTKALITGNSAKDSGGGIYNFGDSGFVTVTDSTIRGNGANLGGGIYNSGGATINLANSTVSENGAVNGGGINNNSTVNLINVTVARNSASASAGGILSENTGTITAHNSLIGDNVVITYRANGENTQASSDFKGILTSQGYNLIENTAEITINGTTTGNILGQDPQLMPPGTNGVVLNILGLLATSPAIDTADQLDSPTTDQRGIPRPQDGDLNGSYLPDIGAYERKATTFTVTKTIDTNDGICNADCSLREAFAAMVASNAPDKVVNFDSVIFAEPQTVNVTAGLISVPDNFVFAVMGTGANLLTISGNHTSRLFALGQGSTAAFSSLKITKSLGTGILYYGSTLTVNDSIISDNLAGGFYGAVLTINNSTVTGNINPGDGAGIYTGRVIMNNSVVSNNTSTGGNGGGMVIGSGSIINSVISGNESKSQNGYNFYYGGGIYAGSDVTIINSTISNNKTDGVGGGIYNSLRTYIFNCTVSNNSAGSGGGLFNSFHALLNITNSTVSGNTSNFDGGGIYNDAQGSTAALNLNSTTIANNSAARDGGGILNHMNGAILYSRNSIIGHNTATNSGADIKGNLISQGYNLIENITGMTISGESSNNILGQDPRLDPVLRNNGGPTLTHALLAGSPAINTGDNTNATAGDQRGLTRIVGGTIDIGAYEFAPTSKARKRVRVL